MRLFAQFVLEKDVDIPDFDLSYQRDKYATAAIGP